MDTAEDSPEVELLADICADALEPTATDRRVGLLADLDPRKWTTWTDQRVIKN